MVGGGPFAWLTTWCARSWGEQPEAVLLARRHVPRPFTRCKRHCRVVVLERDASRTTVDPLRANCRVCASSPCRRARAGSGCELGGQSNYAGASWRPRARGSVRVLPHRHDATRSSSARGDRRVRPADVSPRALHRDSRRPNGLWTIPDRRYGAQNQGQPPGHLDSQLPICAPVRASTRNCRACSPSPRRGKGHTDDGAVGRTSTTRGEVDEAVRAV